MPSQFSRLGEKLRQQLKPTKASSPGSSKEWRPTSNARNLAMIEESRAFAKHVKLLLEELNDTNGGLVTRVEASLGTMRTVLTASLPRAFDETGAGVAPMDSGDQIGGMAVDHSALASSGQEMRQRLTDEVMLPLQQWLAAYRGIKARNKTVEEVRLDLDTKRREMLQLEERFAKLQGQNGKDAEDLLYKAKSKEFKVGLLASRYRELEEEVFNALLNLISDTAKLRDYQATALAIVQRCFTSAHKAFNANTTFPEAIARSSTSNPQSTSKQSDMESSQRDLTTDKSCSRGAKGVWVQHHSTSSTHAQPDLQCSQSDSDPISECESESYPAEAIHSFNERFEDLALSTECEFETLPNAGVASGSSAAQRSAAKKWCTEAPASAEHADNVEQQSNSPPLIPPSTQPAAATPAQHDTPFLSPAAAQSLQQQLGQSPSPGAPTPDQPCPSQVSDSGPRASPGSLPNASGASSRAPGSFPIASFPIGSTPCSAGSFSSASGSFSTACGTPPEAPSSPARTPGCPPHASGTLPNVPGTLPNAAGTLPSAFGILLPDASGCSPSASGTLLPYASGTLPNASGNLPSAYGNLQPNASGTLLPDAPGRSPDASGTLLPDAPGCLPKTSGVLLPKACGPSPRTSGSTSDSPTTLGSSPRASGAGSSLLASGSSRTYASLATASGLLPNASSALPDTSREFAQGTAPSAPYPSVPNMSYAAESRTPGPSWFTEAKANTQHPRQDREADQRYPVIPSGSGNFAQDIAPMAPILQLPTMSSADRPAAPTWFAEAQENAEHEEDEEEDDDEEEEDEEDKEGQDSDSGLMSSTNSLDIAASAVLDGLERQEASSAPAPLPRRPARPASAAAVVGDEEGDEGQGKGIAGLAFGFVKAGLQVGAAGARMAGTFEDVADSFAEVAEGFGALAEGFETLAGSSE